MFDQIDKFPVIIVSTPRTGSTALQQVICKHHGLDGFNEAHWEPDYFKYFLEYQRQNTKFCLKVHSCDLYNFADTINLFGHENIYWISLRRRDIVDQIASFYLARKRDKWFNYGNDEYEDYVIDIDKKDLSDTIFATLKYKNCFNDLNFKFDMDLYYEDLELGDADTILTDYPENYNELKDLITKELEVFLKWNNVEKFKVMI